MTTDLVQRANDNLAVREYTDQQLQQRMKANVAARFGLQDATPAQLNIVFLLAKRWMLDPVNEIALYEGRPFITLDGRLQLMRRNPDYRGYRTRPLKREEREDWGYEPEDIVVECTVLTHGHGEITERGCVRRTEVDSARARAKESGKRSAPVGIYAPEIAEKRAIARASRAAFGQDVPDEDEVGYIIEERNDPARVALNAAKYDAIYGTEDERDTAGDPPKPEEMVKSAKATVVQELAGLIEAAAAGGIDIEPFNVTLPAPLSTVRAKIAAAQQAIDAAQGAPQQVALEETPF